MSSPPIYQPQFNATLRVFLGSTMAEFDEERRLLQATLSRDTLIDAFVWELSQGADIGTVLDTSLSRIEQSDIAIFLFGCQFGQITIEEFNCARSLGRPCLIYITEESTGRDLALQEFLNKHILDPRNGITYYNFKDVVELLAIVPKDLRHHLIAAYRNASRTMPTGALSNAVRLASDVSAWHQFHQTCTLAGEPRIVDRRTIDLMFRKRLTEKRGYFQEYFIRCIAGLVDAEDVAAFLKDHSDLDGMLISDHGFTGASLQVATTVPGREVATIDEFIEQSVDFTGYIDSMESLIHLRKIEHSYLRVQCVESTRYAGITSNISVAPVDLDDFIVAWLKDPLKEHLTLIGEFGSGKTWALQHLTYLAIQSYRAAKKARISRPRIPIFLELKETRALSVEEMIEATVVKCGVPKGAVQELNRMGKILFLFDGFDEMSARVDRETLAKHYWQLAKVLVPGGKVILTCRSEHFQNPIEGRSLLKGELRDCAFRLSTSGPQFQIIELQPLPSTEVSLWFQRHARSEMVDIMFANPELAEICRRPLMLEFILEAGATLMTGGLMDYARVLMLAVCRKLERDVHESRTITSVIDKFLFLSDLSWWLIQRGVSTFTIEAVHEIISSAGQLDTSGVSNIEVIVRDMVGQTVLVHANEDQFCFSHRALLEFFVAYKFVAKLGVMSKQYLEIVRDTATPDEGMEVSELGWTEYVNRRRLWRGTGQSAVWLQTFKYEFSENGKDDDMSIDANMFSRNTFVLAAGMVDRDPESIDRLCSIALEGTSMVAWNVQCFLPFLKGKDVESLVETLIARSGGGPVKRGVAWALGELGVASESVIRALRVTVESLGKPGGSTPEDWAKAAFALEKLGVLGKSDTHRSQETVAYLVEHLPEHYTAEIAYGGLVRSFLSGPTEPSARVDQCDVLAVVKFREEIDMNKMTDVCLSLDYRNDLVGRRIFYAVWLIGHLGLAQLKDQLIEATTHPHGSVRHCACEALGKLRIRDNSVSKVLEGLLNDRYYKVRLRAAWGLKKLEVLSAIPELERAAAREEVPDIAEYMKQVIGILQALKSGTLPVDSIGDV